MATTHRLRAPHCNRRQAHRGAPLHEPFGMGDVGSVERVLPMPCEVGDASKEDVGRREQSEARVVVAICVPVEDVAKPGACVRCAAPHN